MKNAIGQMEIASIGLATASIDNAVDSLVILREALSHSGADMALSYAGAIQTVIFTLAGELTAIKEIIEKND